MVTKDRKRVEVTRRPHRGYTRVKATRRVAEAQLGSRGFMKGNEEKETGGGKEAP